jgi:phage-related protein
MPCPYERKIQRDWETKSNKSWYNLSEDSAKKALQSMKKIKEQKINVGKISKVGSKK